MSAAPLPLAGRSILLGVSGGVAAVKIPLLVRLLRQAGARVRVILTRMAAEFVTPLALQSFGAEQLFEATLSTEQEQPMAHIELARWADLVLVAPATAHLLARLAAGLADDRLTTTLLALKPEVPCLLAPAMNGQMWQAAATVANVSLLQQRGYTLCGPAAGELACGEVGEGRMVEPQQLLEAIVQRLAVEPILAGVAVTVTAGPTREPLDPVRYLTNQSSGQMGYALAAAAVEFGAAVTLISGPTALPPPAGVTLLRVTTAAEMYQAALAHTGTLFIAAAAVADYRVATVAPQKVKKGAANWSLTLVPTADIVQAVAALPPPQRPFTVGFAAETDDLLTHARQKLLQKRLDLVAANWVNRPDVGFNSATNQLELLWADGGISLPLQEKPQLARQMLQVVAARYRATLSPTTP